MKQSKHISFSTDGNIRPRSMEHRRSERVSLRMTAAPGLRKAGVKVGIVCLGTVDACALDYVKE